MENIELYSTAEIVKELEKRYDHCVFAGVQIRSNRAQRTVQRYSGNYHMCIGLCSGLEIFIYDKFDNSLRRDDEK